MREPAVQLWAMLHPTICPQCFQPNEPARPLCWKCLRSLAIPANESDYLRLFGLRGAWDLNDLKSAFHRLARKYHPDVNPGNREADAHFKFVNQAYEVLSVRSNQPPSAEPPKRKIDAGSQELNDKLRAVIRESRSKNTPPVKPPSSLEKLGRWFNKIIK